MSSRGNSPLSGGRLRTSSTGRPSPSTLSRLEGARHPAAQRESICIVRECGSRQLKIRDALPQVFNRAYPVLDPKMPMLPAVSMLRFQQIDGLPLVVDVTTSRPRALHGYSLLKRLLAIG